MSLHDYSPGGDYLFAGNLSGIEFRLLDLEMYNPEDDEKPDPEIEGDVHGNWLHVETDDFEDGYISGVGELIEELQRLEAEAGDLFKVTRCQKSGPKQTDPYEVNLEEIEPDQSRLV